MSSPVWSFSNRGVYSFLDERIPQRIWNKVSPCPMSGCWIWTAWLDRYGYGSTHFKGRKVKAHRLMYAEIVGDLTSDRDLDHLCRVRCCVNPAHLEPVTRAENLRRGFAGQINGDRQRGLTHCLRGHVLDASNTRLSSDGRIRNCRACARSRGSRERAREEERRYLEGRDEDGLDRWSIADDLRAQGDGQ